MMKRAFLTMSIVVIAIMGSACSMSGSAGHSFETEQTFQVGDIEAIEIENESWDIDFNRTDSKQITISAVGEKRDEQSQPVVIKKDGNKLIVTQREEKVGFMDYFTFNKEETISISIPNHGVDKITVNNRNGNVGWNDVAIDNIVLSNETGTTIVEGLTADTGQFTSEHGELSMKRSSVNELTIASTTGDNDINNVTSSSMKITNRDGTVLVKDANESESLVVQTKSGDIMVSYKKAPTSLAVSASSHISDIAVQLNGYKETKNTNQSKSGVIGKGVNNLELTSEYGTIDVR
ncbi:DUF4097 family beta strand repeat-containing protein [Paenibacillus assamensis]|uniref:DUF4097 family beta strand repeat-containing protein n=1 Tax=Paenibacillus assamensis TaxID=311244 RepID=UPI0003FAC0E5|nr:DUF4097 family beta strand repeat-containing protein [Paenibacillus assamensis]